ncbi:MAG: hypothetical protein ACKVP0_08950 [Pirellulaceae bacterium]
MKRSAMHAGSALPAIDSPKKLRLSRVHGAALHAPYCYCTHSRHIFLVVQKSSAEILQVHTTSPLAKIIIRTFSPTPSSGEGYRGVPLSSQISNHNSQIPHPLLRIPSAAILNVYNRVAKEPLLDFRPCAQRLRRNVN